MCIYIKMLGLIVDESLREVKLEWPRMCRLSEVTRPPNLAPGVVAARV